VRRLVVVVVVVVGEEARREGELEALDGVDQERPAAQGEAERGEGLDVEEVDPTGECGEGVREKGFAEEEVVERDGAVEAEGAEEEVGREGREDAACLRGRARQLECDSWRGQGGARRTVLRRGGGLVLPSRRRRPLCFEGMLEAASRARRWRASCERAQRVRFLLTRSESKSERRSPTPRRSEEEEERATGASAEGGPSWTRAVSELWSVCST